MARILHVITGLTTGGAEIMLWKLLSATKERHSQAVVSLMDEGSIGPRIAGLDVPVHSLGLRAASPNPLRALSLRRIARKFDPHLVVGWMYHGNLMASFAAGGTRMRAPVIWTVHQSLSSLATERWRTAAAIRLGAMFSARASAIVYVSQAGKKQHESIGYGANLGLAIPNGIDCQTFVPDARARAEIRSEWGFTDSSIIIGLVARCHPMKNHAGFLHAASLVAREHATVKFVLIGKGVREHAGLQALIQELHMQDRMLLLGERPDMPRLTAAFDIACSASAWGEAFSVAIGEAMACGIPCVVTDVGDSSFIVGETGLTVPPRSPEALAGAFHKLVAAGPEYRQQLGAAARSRIETMFSFSTMVCRYEDLYRKHLSEDLSESEKI